MRSALLCVMVALTVHKESGLAADEEFRPTPIPLTEWNIGDKQGGAGTLEETLATDAAPAVAAVPAHYWEDALRHSVYLTLVRDKIDQLIAKTSALSTDNRSEHQNARDVDDRDLWEKIKSAPFDRLNAEEPSSLGDIAVVAKGRLLEETDGFRFTEDELTKEKCRDEKCTDTVKAFWSVKRVRQRDAETVPGKHHYELTFSVSSHTPKKHNRPFENPVRTFTVREGTPVEKPQYRHHGPPGHPPRPQRAIWFHKNIAPSLQEPGLDRLFSSWFGSDEESREPPIKRYRYSHHNYPQRSKVGYVGLQSEQHHQKQLVPFTYKSHSYKVGRPLGPPPVQHAQFHYNADLDGIRQQNHYTPAPTEYKYISNIVKTTKPAVLPTPPSTFPVSNVTTKMANISSTIETTTTTRDSDIITAFTTYSKPKPTKVNYFPEHVRPPIFNAPPGVFVTMEKKPFKPMPPIKFLHSSKPLKIKPIDFRPSPQVLDVQFSDPDPLSDAFRPITMSYAGSNTTESSELADNDKVHHFRKTKPPKKHDRVKSQRTTTNAPEIITAYNEALDDMHWANILGAFTKTTSMDFHKHNVTDTTTSTPFNTVATNTTEKTTSTTTKTEPSNTTSTTTMTSKPRRTRPPPKFTKPIKSKKTKRITTTSTSTTTEPSSDKRIIQDLTPQASSSATINGDHTESKSNAKTENITIFTTPMTANDTNISTSKTTESSTTKAISTTSRSTTTTRPTTPKQKPSTTIKTTSSTTEIVSSSSTITPRSKNRFRQSTLMIKGTSVKHDKWNTPFFINKTTTERSKLAQTSNAKLPLRRKGSNFQGYISSTAKSTDEEQHRENHVDGVSSENFNVVSIKSTTVATEVVPVTTSASTSVSTSVPTPAQEESIAQNNQSEISSPTGYGEPEDDADEDVEDQEGENEEEETQDHDEYNFTTTDMEDLKDAEASETSNEVESGIVTTTEETVVDVATSLNYAVKNKTKCKNRRQNTTVNYESSKPEIGLVAEIPKSLEDEVSVKPISTTEKMSTSDFFDEIFGFTMDQNETGNNHTESKYVDNDDDLEEFLQSINKKSSRNDTNEYEYPDDEREESSPYNNEEENRFPRHADRTYEDYQDNPLSLLELMAME